MEKISNAEIPYSLHDYRQMFDLREADLKRSILNYPGGISSFTAEMHALEHDTVVSGDVYYHEKLFDMTKRVDRIIQALAEQFNPQNNRSDLLNAWNHSAQLFLSDYSQGQLDGRYRAMRLPHLPFSDFQFELALCSNPSEPILFELCRIAQEVRAFPVLDGKGEVSQAVGLSMLALQDKNFGMEIRAVPYRLLTNGNGMLRVWAKACVVPK